jgi:MFS family permease
LLGGILSQELGWRWVLFVNLPLCVVLLISSFRVVTGEKRAASLTHFDLFGAATVTGGMLLLIYTLIRVPEVGWGSWRSIAGLFGSAVLLIAFVFNELRHPRPLLPLSIFRIKGLGAADATQVISMAGFYSMFFFVTLYMQNVLHFSPLRAGVSYVPVTLGVAASAGISSKLFERVGTRPIIVGGSLIAASGVYWLSQIPVNGTYVSDLLPGLMIMSIGLGAVFTGVTTAANAGVPPDKAGLAAGLVNTSQWFGAALGLAIFSSIATSRTNQLLSNHVSAPLALTQGFHRALLASSLFLVGAAIIALRATNTRGEPVLPVDLPESFDERSDRGAELPLQASG